VKDRETLPNRRQENFKARDGLCFEKKEVYLSLKSVLTAKAMYFVDNCAFVKVLDQVRLLGVDQRLLYCRE
jgi:hypothetical protein